MKTEPPEKKKQRPIDPTLVAARRLDNIFADLSPQMRTWALQWLTAKYAGKEVCNADAPPAQ